KPGNCLNVVAQQRSHAEQAERSFRWFKWNEIRVGKHAHLTRQQGHRLSQLISQVVRFWPADNSRSAANVRFRVKAVIVRTHLQRQRTFSSKTWSCIAHGLYYSCLCAGTPFFKMLVRPVAKGLNYRVI